MQVSVHELKNHLSKYIHRLEEGRSIIVTSHHTPVAKLTPITSCKNTMLHTLLQLDEVHWNGKKPSGNKRSPKIAGHTTADYVLEDRR